MLDFKKATRKVAVAVCAGALTVGMAAPAYALTPRDDANIPSSTMTTTGSYIKGAATRAASPSIEILGLASVEESGQFVDTSEYFNWAQPKYMIVASGYNTSASPFLANLATGLGTSEYPAAVLNSARNGGGAGPNGSLQALGGSDATDQAVWALEPDVVVGTGGNVAYPSFAAGVTYSFSDYAGLIGTMQGIAAAADAADAADASRSLRYGSASAIAQRYANYVNGTRAAVSSYVATTLGGEARAVALVTSVSYDSATDEYTYTLMTDDGSNSDGTASVNRYLETTSNPGSTAYNVATNYADGLVAEGVPTATITSSELVDAVADGDLDLIMVGGQSNSSGYADIMKALVYDELVESTYFVRDNGSAGSQYGVVMNSVENAQNVGRILGMLYPEVVNQQDWMAYYYEQFYHIDGSKLSTVMAQALLGVRNAAVTSVDYSKSQSEIIADVTSWSGNAGYASGHSASMVEAVINPSTN